jgi:hypothetical protein
MKKILIPCFVLAIGTALLVVGCGGAEGDGPSDHLELRNYQVPEIYQSEIRSTLQSVLRSRADEPIGRVSELPGGKLAVLAPASVHEGIENLLKDFADAEGLAAGRESISLDYWFLVGRPLNGNAGTGLDDRRISAIRPALDRIREVDGPLEFRLIEKINLISMQGHSATAQGRFAQVHHRASAIGDAAVAEVTIQYFNHSHRLESNITLEQDQILVLAQTGYPEGRKYGLAFHGANNNEDVTLYFILTSGR